MDDSGKAAKFFTSKPKLHKQANEAREKQSDPVASVASAGTDSAGALAGQDLLAQAKGAAPPGLPREPKGAAPTGLRSDEGATREGGASRAPGGERGQ